MKKILTLSNEQAGILYNLLFNYEVADRSANRKRLRFLEVMEDVVDKYSDDVKAFAGKDFEDVKDKIDKLKKVTYKFLFNDREIFAQVKEMFEKTYEVGTLSSDQMGKVIRSPLTGYNAKLYMEIEDAFADVKDIKE